MSHPRAEDGRGVSDTHRRLGWGLLLLSVVFNPLSLGLMASDGGIESMRVRMAIIALEAALALASVAVLRRWDRVVFGGAGGLRVVAVAAALMLALAGAEGLVRLVMGPIDQWAPAPIYVGEMARACSH